MAIKPDILKTWGPGGWSFYQPETDWHAPGPLENTFDQQVKNIIAMRQANPRFHLPTDEAAVAAELEAYTLARWSKTYSKKGMAKFMAGQPLSEDKKKESRSTFSGKSRLGGVAALAGIRTASLEDWLGYGGVPVDQVEADARAEICAGCDANKGNWREMLTVPAAAAIKAYLAHRNRMRLSTPFDDQLESCAACHCVLTLKVWQPIQHVRDNTTPEELFRHRKANPDCWVLANMPLSVHSGIPDKT